MTHKKGHITLKPLMALLLIMMGGLLTACSSDDALDGGTTGDGDVTEQLDGMQVVSFTRAGGRFTADSDYSPIRLFLWSTEDGTQSELFYLNTAENIWKSKLEVTSSRNYLLYGYSPATEGEGTLVSPSADGATVKLTGVSAISASDVCVVVGVQQVNTPEDTKNIPLGAFGFIGKSTTDGNYVNLLMDHVMAALSVNVTINSEYAQLRSIKLKEMKLLVTRGTVDITVPLTPNTAEVNPIGSVTYNNVAGTENSAVFFKSETGIELSDETATEATCCFAPTAAVYENLSLTTTYEVYDRKGNLIGERTATNKLPTLTATRGQRVTLTLTVNPTYLNMLSDPDLDNPTLNIED